MSQSAFDELARVFGPTMASEALWSFTAYPFAGSDVVLKQARQVIARANGGSIEALFRELHAEVMREIDAAIGSKRE